MNWFYIIVSIIAIIILILSLTFVALMMKKNNQNQTFPSNTSQCPDLWIPDGSFCYFNGLNYGNYNRTNVDSKNNPGHFLSDSVNIYDVNYSNTHFNTSPFFTSNNISNTTINPFDERWGQFGMTATCFQKQWATTNNIEWTGIREYNNC